ncbi:Aminopeptidase P family protein [Candidatus Cyrtobacter comes]|uniref:Aminopeptidase P family protein n=1 Tax=Candidatus Cyrtobacter comes TaxID=675776 RepID=A0ABU5L6U9_9RICK|nr:aminopeptidase family protein P [Candidatus Cyrtobacter comes]MDZ5761849.1 Aminopeptidase P family protein [Candidatus Cyrtobacter comes]
MKEKTIRAIRRNIVLSNAESFGIDGVIVSNTGNSSQEKDSILMLTGFKCSNCLLIINRSHCLFATDKRYIEQAKEYLSKEFDLYQSAAENQLLALVYDLNFPKKILVVDMSEQSYQDALLLFSNTVLGYDPMLHTVSNVEYYEKLFSKNKIELLGINRLIELISNDFIFTNKDIDLLSQIKLHNIPLRIIRHYNKKIEKSINRQNNIDAILHLFAKETQCNNKIFNQIKPNDAKSYTSYLIADHDINSKIKKILEKIDKDSDFLFSNNPDEICWLLNIRGNGSLYTPIVSGYLFLAKNNGDCYLFTDFTLPSELIEQSFLKVFNINEMENFCSKIAEKSIELDPKYTISYFVNKFKLSIRKPSIIEQLKAIKTPSEIENIRKAHVIDGAAISKFIYWLYSQQHSTESSAADKLLKIRTSFKEFISNSFETISAFGSNSSMIHYSTQHNVSITKDGLYLLDAGGQYFYGTTDMTRTMCLGIPTQEQKRMFTLVLKGHIRLAQAVFPEGTSGSNIDVLARLDLWKEFSDYGHGTGHGVGYLLSVHEGPQSINMKNTIKLEEGMVLSNEPGFYKEGKYGIRIENIMYIKKLTDKFLCFETLTVVPILNTLIDTTLLVEQEVNWLNEYNEKTLSEIGRYLSEEELSFFKRNSLVSR